MDTLEKWPSTIMQTLCLVPNTFTCLCAIKIPKMGKLPYSVKQKVPQSQQYLNYTKFTQ